MDSYVNITVLPDADMSESLLFNKLYSKFHKALCALQAHDIGVSFPEAKINLGRVMRIHSTAVRLEQLQQLSWLGGLLGYCKVSEIQTIPFKVEYRVISRIQSTMTQAKLNRLIKRGSIEPEKVRDYKAKMFSRGLDNPYLELESTSNGHKHRRYIAFSELLDEPMSGTFDHFGLSKQATIPWF